MRYLVTGGTGFIGSALVKRLLSIGHEVTVLDNGSRNLTKFDELEIKPKVIIGDIRDYSTVALATRGIDSILHLAFVNGTKNFYLQPSLIIDVGINGMMNLMKACQENEISRFVLFSSSEVYQQPILTPTPESESLKIPDILNPRYSYGGAKAASELILANFGDNLFHNWQIVRPHNIYGPNMGTDHVIPELMSKCAVATTELEILGNGSQTRAFCHISDFIDAIEIILNSNSTDRIYHVGTDEEVSIGALAKMIVAHYDKKLKLKFVPAPLGETTRRCPDIQKITQLGYRQRISLAQGIELMIKSQQIL